jgi:hypothetical protein
MFPHMVAAPTSPLPDLPREDRRRLSLFFSCNEDLAALAAALNKELPPPPPPTALPQSSAPTPDSQLPPQHSAPSTQHSPPDLDEFTLQSWSTRPDISAHIDYRRREAEYRARKTALHFLEEVLRATNDLIEKRRAASAILRTLNRAGAPIGRTGHPTTPVISNALSRNSASHASHSSHQSHSNSSTSSETSTTSTTSTTYPQDPDDLADDAEDDTDTDFDDTNPDDSPIHPSTHSPLHTNSTLHPPLSIPQAFSPKPSDIQAPPTPLPDPARTPQDLVDLITQAIQQPNLPERNTGPFTLFNLKGIIKDRSPAAFAQFRGNYIKHMVRDAWEFASHRQRWLKVRPANLKLLLPIRVDTAYALIDLTLRDNSTRVLHISLYKETEGVLKDCWLLEHFIIGTRQIKPADPDDPFNDTG